jgi:ubiquinone/menaquinone biosynthesis C-methylase UbiE
MNDRQYLEKQYKDSSNLDARFQLHQRFSVNKLGWHRWVFDQFDLPPACRILELGCGPGYLWLENLARIPPGWEILLSDFSAGMLDEARRNLEQQPPFQFQVIDAQSIHCEGAYFDAVIANHMLYHVPDRKLALTEIRRVLKTDGILFASTVGENHMKEMYGWLKRINTNPSGGMFTNPFTMESGAGQLREVFTTVDQSRYVDSLRVTEVEPLIAYIRSSIGAADISEEELKKLQSEFLSILAANNEIFISKDSGIFIARK